MKTKEIDVSVELYGDGTIRDISLFDSTYDTKAKLIVEMPEQKVEITEKVIYDIYNLSRGYCMDDGSNVQRDFEKSLRQILGFKDE